MFNGAKPNSDLGFKGFKSFSECKDWANGQLRFAIAVLRGEWGWSEPFSWKYRFFTAQMIKKRLLEYGFWWQAKVLGFWINRFKRGDFTGGVPPLAGVDLQPLADGGVHP